MKKIVALLSLALLFTNCAKSKDELLFLQVKNYLGTYEGTWKEPLRNVSGKATVIISADKSTRVVNMVIDFDGNFLDIGDLPAQTLTGKYDSNNAHLQGKNPLLGDYDMTISKDGDVDGLMKEIMTGLFPQMTLKGKVTPTNADMTSTITAKSGGKTDLVLAMTKKN